MISRRQKHIPQVLLCVVLSLLLHLVIISLILLLPPPQHISKTGKERKARVVRLLRTEIRKKADKKLQQEKTDAALNQHPDKQKAFAKTSADTPQARPDYPEYEGSRNTRAASAPDARHRASAAHAPAMNGEEKKELVTFDQQRQEGELEHEARVGNPTPPAPPTPPQPQPPTSAATEPPDEGRPDAAPSPISKGKDAADSQIDATNSLTLSDDLSGQLRLREEAPHTPMQSQKQETARKGVPQGAGKSASRATPRRQKRAFYDPSLAEWAQKPGFRTHERRSRSNGRFVLGKGAALNVASTPRGMYEALVYRRVAHFWYIACDEHRGDIIPGKITISLRITRRGQIDSMALIRRSGASISQQSFTFKAIRKATLPPMPPEVQADVIGPLMELIFEFNFD